MLEYFEGGLEAGVEFECGYCGLAGMLEWGDSVRNGWGFGDADVRLRI